MVHKKHTLDSETNKVKLRENPVSNKQDGLATLTMEKT